MNTLCEMSSGGGATCIWHVRAAGCLGESVFPRRCPHPPALLSLNHSHPTSLRRARLQFSCGCMCYPPRFLSKRVCKITRYLDECEWKPIRYLGDQTRAILEAV
jgi:hypothetical protein